MAGSYGAKNKKINYKFIIFLKNFLLYINNMYNNFIKIFYYISLRKYNNIRNKIIIDIYLIIL